MDSIEGFCNFASKSSKLFIAMKESIILILSLLFTSFYCHADSDIRDIWLEANAVQKDERGLKIHTDLQLGQVKGKLVELQAIFYATPGGRALRDKNNKYRLSPSLNYVSSSHYFTPKDNNYKAEDVTIFIPTEELHITGSRKYRVYVKLSLYTNPGNTGEFLAESDYIPFIVDMTGSTPRLAADKSGNVTVAQAKEIASQRGKGASVKTSRGQTIPAPRPTTVPKRKGKSHNSKIEKEEIDPETFWDKEEVDSASLPKIYIE